MSAGPKKLDSNRTQKEAHGDDEDEEDTWEPEDRAKKALDLFIAFDYEQSL